MPGLLADVNAEGQLKVLVSILQGEPWRDIWSELGMPVETFGRLELSDEIPDLDLWQICQSEHLLLITGNRNRAGDDSLESTIERWNQPESLPVLTLANPGRLMKDRDYAALTAERLLEKLIDLDQFRGTGRLYLP